MRNKYVIITPIHNEEKYIEQLIKCVVAQSILPMKWVMVDDESTDKSAEIIKQYELQYDFIDLLQLRRNDIRTYYARRTQVFLLGLEAVKGIECDFIGSLDADITLKSTYYENILKTFHHNTKLGIASGVYWDKVNGKLKKVFRSKISTPGALQLFRRECYEDIGGYIPLEYGGDDTLADCMARMYGWETGSYKQYPVIHHRPVGTGGSSGRIKGKFRQGIAEYELGSHPFFILSKSLLRFFWEKPLFIASMARLMGYLYAHLRKKERQVPNEIRKYIRNEQMKRLKALFGRG